MIPILTFCGSSNSGKTKIVTQIIDQLTSNGYIVASLKHAGHKHDLMSGLKGDSGKHKIAGAKASVVSNNSGILMAMDVSEDMCPLELCALLPDGYDIVICEGFKNSSIPKVEVYKKDFERVKIGKDVIAVVSDDPDVNHPVCYDINDIKGLYAFVEQYLHENRQSKEFHLYVNDKPVQTKDFIQKMLLNAIYGLVKPLKGCEEIKNITIKAGYTKN